MQAINRQGLFQSAPQVAQTPFSQFGGPGVSADQGFSILGATGLPGSVPGAGGGGRGRKPGGPIDPGGGIQPGGPGGFIPPFNNPFSPGEFDRLRQGRGGFGGGFGEGPGFPDF